MIIVNFKGGLGNQLFQYAFGRGLSKYYKTGLIIDKSIYDKNNKREFLLEKLNIRFEGYYKNIKNEILKKLIIKIKKINFVSKTKIFEEKFYHFDKSIYKLNKKSYHYYFDGYWQSYKYFKNVADQLKKELSFSKFISSKSRKVKLIKKLKKKNTIGIHVRGGDYRKEPFLSFNGLLDANYYNKSVNEMRKKFKIGNIFIFTDDIDYLNTMSSKFNFNFQLVSNCFSNSALEDFALFYLIKNKIISNSTFAWWCAFLSKNLNVIYPKKWFKIQYNNIKDLCPNSWKKI
jgi:hypothetical protein